MHRSAAWVALLLLVPPLTWPRPVPAQNLVSRVWGGDGGGFDNSQAPLGLTMADVEAAIQQLQSQVTQSRAEDPAAPGRQLELDLWRRIRLEMQQIDAIQSQNVDLEAKLNRLQQQRRDWDQRTLPAPTSGPFLAVDELRDQRYAQRQHQKTVETEVELARDKREQALRRRDNADRRFRAAQDIASRSSGTTTAEEQAGLELRGWNSSCRNSTYA